VKRGLKRTILLIGLALVAAPAVFGMFTRAPNGGHMINDFRPFMSEATVAKYKGYMAEIDRAHAESSTVVPLLAQQGLGLDASGFAERFPSIDAFNRQWPGIFADMNGDMLATMDSSVDNFAAVDSLPPFWMFPWFFVLPGLIIAGLAWAALRRDRKGTSPRSLVRWLGVMGVGLILAPAIFVMFSRAPLGAEMINDFRPFMTEKRLTTIQGYFLTIGGGEGELRNAAEPALQTSGLGEAGLARALPSITAFHADWPRISGDMAPMIGVMADNIANFAGVDALPPFSLFPWFFVLPGIMVLLLGIRAGRGVQSAGHDALAARELPSPETSAGLFDDIRRQAAEKRAVREAAGEREQPVPTGQSKEE
jgi:hypothetical protein